jgi:hypothetical protein
MRASKIHYVAHVVAKLWLIHRQSVDHLVRNIGLKLGILNSSRIAQYIEHHLSGAADLFRDVLEIIGQSVVIGRQTERLGQRLITDISMIQWIERANARVRLRHAFFQVASNCSRL